MRPVRATGPNRAARVPMEMLFERVAGLYLHKDTAMASVREQEGR